MEDGRTDAPESPIHGQARRALEAATALFLNNRLVEAASAGELVLRRTELPTAVKIDALLLMGEIAREQYRYQDALCHVLGALRVAETCKDAIGQSRSHAEHARVLNRIGLVNEALSASYEALRLAGDDPDRLARALGPLAAAQQALAPPTEARRTSEAMLLHAQQSGNMELQAWANRGLCGVWLIQHHLDEQNATEFLNRGNSVHLSRAMHHAIDATQLSLAAGSRHGVRLGHYLQAGVLTKQRDFAGARIRIEHLVADAEDDAPLYRALALKSTSTIEMLEHDYERAKSSLQEALTIFESLGDLREAGDCCDALCRVFEAQEDYKAALAWKRRHFEAYLRFSSAAARAHAAAMAVRHDAESANARAQKERSRAEQLERSNNALALEAERLTRAALEDGLTGIGNRRRFDQELRSLMADRRGRQRCSIALLDVDHFKRVNDRFSHLVGDQVLRQIARILEHNSRTSDIVARYGGEEFAILLVGMDQDQALRACERIRVAVEKADWTALHPQLQVTVSLGLGHFDEAGDEGSDLLALVDRRLYEAKDRGRNRVAGPGSEEIPS